MSTFHFPRQYLITPDWPLERLQVYLAEAIRGGVDFLQIRSPSLSVHALEQLLSTLRNKHHSVQVLLSSRLPEAQDLAEEFETGLHWPSRVLMQQCTRPFGKKMLVAASCHNSAELAQAERLDLDFVVLSPVQATHSHPDAESMGWDAFGRLCAQVTRPVLALGGMTWQDEQTVLRQGGAGLAGISLFVERFPVPENLREVYVGQECCRTHPPTGQDQ